MTRRYSITEIFLTLQGEGGRAGRRSVFVRFAGCNFWDGRAESRSRGAGACARWCDTDFAPRERLTAEELGERIRELWGDGRPEVVFTGGEPLLQVDAELLQVLGCAGVFVCLETNGSRPLPGPVDWVTLSPKLTSAGEVPALALHQATELKVILPGALPDAGGGWTDSQLAALSRAGRWERLYVQPQDPVLETAVEASWLKGASLPDGQETFRRHLERCVDFVMRHPAWALSYQVHKAIGVR